MNSPAAVRTDNQIASITTDDLKAISDIYVWDCDDIERGINASWLNIGRSRNHNLEGQPIAEWVTDVLRRIQLDHPRESGDDDFMIEVDGLRFRCHRDPTVGDHLIAMRQGTMKVPMLEDLLLPRWWPEVLLQKAYTQKGGLVLMAAETGCGKSTTIAAMIASRLTRFGGHCRTIEDPAEFPLHGPWGDGICVQREVDHSLPPREQFSGPMRDFLRAYPASTDGGRIMVVGEVRDGAAAAELVRNACNGMLVISTIHADNEATAIKRLCALAKDELGSYELACDMVSSSLRCSMSQRLVPNNNPGAKGWHRYVVEGTMLLSDGPTHSVGHNIAKGKFSLLAQAQETQKTQFKTREPRETSVEEFIGGMNGA